MGLTRAGLELIGVLASGFALMLSRGAPLKFIAFFNSCLLGALFLQLQYLRHPSLARPNLVASLGRVHFQLVGQIGPAALNASKQKLTAAKEILRRPHRLGGTATGLQTRFHDVHLANGSNGTMNNRSIAGLHRLPLAAETSNVSGVRCRVQTNRHTFQV